MIKFQLSRSGFALTLLMSMLPGLSFHPGLMAQTQPLVIPRSSRPNMPRTLPLNKTMPQPSGEVAPGNTVPNVTQEEKRTNLDNLKNSPDQLTTWACNSADKSQMVAVEVKEIDFWQNLIAENKNWQCGQNLPDIPGKKNTFSCEPTDTIGLISVYWLQGKGGEAQMKNWMTALANNHNLVCTSSFTNQFWE
ncbi:MAG: hypothetical protein ACRC6M_19885 [Microcystaceae cyanobacterium]